MWELAEDLEDRCEVVCQKKNNKVREIRTLSTYLDIINYKERCTLVKGHQGPHLGAYDTIWVDTEEE